MGYKAHITTILANLLVVDTNRNITLPMLIY
jgi:hypothetical protein